METMKTTSKSICKVRKEFGLSCGGCVLHGYRECVESKGGEPSVGSLYIISNQGTYGSRVTDRCILHAPFPI